MLYWKSSFLLVACMDECRVVSLWEFFFLYYSNNVTILEDKDSLYKNRHSNFPFITAFSSTWEGSYIFILLHLELWSFCAMCYFIDLCTFSFHVSFLPVWISYIRCWGFRLMNGFMCFLIFICSVYPLFCYPYGNYSGLYSSPWKPAFLLLLSSFHVWFKEDCIKFNILFLKNRSFLSFEGWEQNTIE